MPDSCDISCSPGLLMLSRPLKLAGLSQEAVGQLLQSLSRREPPPQLARVMFAETQGNPFLVEELYRRLVAEGKVFDEAGALRADVSVAEIGVPDTVRLVLERRLERLDEETRAVLTAAAAIGPCFRFEVLQALQDHTAPNDLLVALEQAQRMGLLVPSAGGQEANFAFAHDLVRQTLLATISVPRRQLLQVRAAEALERACTEMESKQAVAIVHHVRQVGTLAENQKLVRYLTPAGKSALETTAQVQAPS